MKEKSRFIGVGITIYIALSGIDRFVYPSPMLFIFRSPFSASL